MSQSPNILIRMANTNDMLIWCAASKSAKRVAIKSTTQKTKTHERERHRHGISCLQEIRSGNATTTTATDLGYLLKYLFNIIF